MPKIRTRPKRLAWRERAKVIDVWLEDRVKTVLPNIMRRSGIDMWVIISREYNEDPVLRTFLPSTWQSARRTTILVVYDPGNGKDLETHAMARYAVGKMFKKAWDKEKEPNQWKALSEFIVAKNPKKIGVNKSSVHALADGITATDYGNLMRALPKNFQERVTNAENVADRLARDTHSERDGGLPKHCPHRKTDNRGGFFGESYPARYYNNRRRSLVVSRPHPQGGCGYMVSPVGFGSA